LQLNTTIFDSTKIFLLLIAAFWPALYRSETISDALLDAFKRQTWAGPRRSGSVGEGAPDED